MAILADDLIWATRLADLVRGAGGTAQRLRTAEALEAAMGDVDRVVVDLTARAYDGVAAIALARAAGRPVLAVGQHDDLDLRQPSARGGRGACPRHTGKLFEDGPRQMAAWLATTTEADEDPAARTSNEEVRSPR